MASAVARALGMLEKLVGRPEGVSLTELVEVTGLAKSATHRTLADLVEAGLVRQDQSHGRYALTLKFVSLGLRHVSSVGLVDLAKPML
ncbi:helix-turn-helix domain-containing protein, partial [Rhodococcus koreensis]